MCKVASNILSTPSRTDNKEWYSRFRVGREDNFKRKNILRVGRDSSVGIATRYGLDGTGIEILVGVKFSAPVQTYPGALLYNGYLVIPEGKGAGAWR
jgi:hypothetical protein